MGWRADRGPAGRGRRAALGGWLVAGALALAAGCDDGGPAGAGGLATVDGGRPGGGGDGGILQQPSGESHWRKLFVSARWTCGLRGSEGRLWCGRAGQALTADLPSVGVPEALAVDTVALALHGERGCAVLKSTGALRCFGAPEVSATSLPAGRFRDVALGAEHGCVLDEAGAAICFGDLTPGDDRLRPPDVPFVRLVAGADFTCGLRKQPDVAGRWVSCWGRVAWSEGLLPQVAVEHLAAGAAFVCVGSRVDPPECLGADVSGRIRQAPQGAYRRLVAGAQFACAEGLDAHLTCWGTDIEVPEGPVVEVAAGAQRLCFVAQADQDTVVCHTVAGPPCVPTAEAANGFDDDCDGAVDEGLTCTPEIVGVAAIEARGDHRSPFNWLVLPDGRRAISWLARGGLVGDPDAPASDHDALVLTAEVDGGGWAHTVVWREPTPSAPPGVPRRFLGLTHHAATLDADGAPAFFLCRSVDIQREGALGYPSVGCAFLVRDGEGWAVLGPWQDLGPVLTDGERFAVDEPIEPRLTLVDGALVAVSHEYAWYDLDRFIVAFRAWPATGEVDPPVALYGRRDAIVDVPSLAMAGVYRDAGRTHAVWLDKHTEEIVVGALDAEAALPETERRVIQCPIRPPGLTADSWTVQAHTFDGGGAPRAFVSSHQATERALVEVDLRTGARRQHPWPAQHVVPSQLGVGGLAGGRAVFWFRELWGDGPARTLVRWVAGEAQVSAVRIEGAQRAEVFPAPGAVDRVAVATAAPDDAGAIRALTVVSCGGAP